MGPPAGVLGRTGACEAAASAGVLRAGASGTSEQACWEAGEVRGSSSLSSRTPCEQACWAAGEVRGLSSSS